jgi:hypothetical protein
VPNALVEEQHEEVAVTLEAAVVEMQHNVQEGVVWQPVKLVVVQAQRKQVRECVAVEVRVPGELVDGIAANADTGAAPHAAPRLGVCVPRVAVVPAVAGPTVERASLVPLLGNDGATAATVVGITWPAGAYTGSGSTAAVVVGVVVSVSKSIGTGSTVVVVGAVVSVTSSLGHEFVHRSEDGSRV